MLQCSDTRELASREGNGCLATLLVGVLKKSHGTLVGVPLVHGFEAIEPLHMGSQVT